MEPYVSEEDNDCIMRLPEEEEIKDFIWAINPIKALGPSYSRILYMMYWHINKEQVISFVC